MNNCMPVVVLLRVFLVIIIVKITSWQLRNLLSAWLLLFVKILKWFQWTRYDWWAFYNIAPGYTTISFLYAVEYYLRSDHDCSRYNGPLQRRHNGRDSVSNHQPHDCLLNRLFRRRSKKTSKLRVTGPCAVNSPHKWPVTRKMFPFDDVIMPCTHASRTNKLHLICYSYVFANGYRAVMAKFKDPLDTSGLIGHSMIFVCNRDVSSFYVIFTNYLPCNDIKILTRKFIFYSCAFFNKGTTPHYFLSGCLLGMFIIYSYHTFP